MVELLPGENWEMGIFTCFFCTAFRCGAARGCSCAHWKLFLCLLQFSGTCECNCISLSEPGNPEVPSWGGCCKSWATRHVYSTPGSSVLHCLLEFAQTQVHWVGDAIQPSHPLSPPSSSCPQSFPASGSFPMSRLFTPAGESTGVSASASVLPMNNHGWLPLGLTGLISLLSKGLSRVFSNTTIQKHLWCSAFTS